MNTEIIIKREKFALPGSRGVRYFFCLDGERFDNQFFVANAAPQDYSVQTTPGAHRLTVNEVGFTPNSVPKEILAYDLEATEAQHVLALKYTKAANLHFVNLASGEVAKAAAPAPAAEPPKTEKAAEPAKKEKSGGCYVATAVYGSYDCPEVWTLRRFRDNTLAETWYGRAFIRTYYAVSPTLVKWFGDTEWFKNMWKPTLDKMVQKLNSEGVENTAYNDRIW